MQLRVEGLESTAIPIRARPGQQPRIGLARYEVRANSTSLFGALVVALLESLSRPGQVRFIAGADEGLRTTDVAVDNAATGRRLVIFGTPPTRQAVASQLAREAYSLVSIDASREELLNAIDSLDSGPPFVSSGVVRVLAAEALHPATPRVGLTPREYDVLGLLLQGNSNREIAEELCLSPNTVRSHLQSISGKFGVTSRAKIAAAARTLGVV